MCLLTVTVTTKQLTQVFRQSLVEVSCSSVYVQPNAHSFSYSEKSTQARNKTYTLINISFENNNMSLPRNHIQ